MNYRLNHSNDVFNQDTETQLEINEIQWQESKKPEIESIIYINNILNEWDTTNVINKDPSTIH